MLTPNTGYQRHTGAFAYWAADTGCFRNPDSFDLDRYLHWLATIQYPERCLFATAPDRFCNAETSLALSLPVLPRIRELALPAALVAQNGLMPETTPWNDIDVLFIGGDDTWKLGHEALTLCVEARRRGKQVHVGRVNSLRRLRTAQTMGARSADGTFLARGPDQNLPRMAHWLKALQEQPMFDFWQVDTVH